MPAITTLISETPYKTEAHVICDRPFCAYIALLAFQSARLTLLAINPMRNQHKDSKFKLYNFIG